MFGKVIQTTLVVASAAAFAGVAEAAIPSSNGVISACSTFDGTIKLIDKEAGETCGPSRTLLEWNQQGPVGPAGAPGPQGPGGAEGAPGPAGEDGVSGYGVVTQSGAVAADGTALVAATCPAGKHVLGGGWWANPQTFVMVPKSRPNGTATAWEVSVRNEHPTVAITFNVYAICASASED